MCCAYLLIWYLSVHIHGLMGAVLYDKVMKNMSLLPKLFCIIIWLHPKVKCSSIHQLRVALRDSLEGITYVLETLC